MSVSSAWNVAGGLVLLLGQVSGGWPCWLPRPRVDHPVFAILPLAASGLTKVGNAIAGVLDSIEQAVEQQNAAIIAASEAKELAAADATMQAEAHASPASDSPQESARLGPLEYIADQLEAAEQVEAASRAEDSKVLKGVTQPPATAASSLLLADSKELAPRSNGIVFGVGQFDSDVASDGPQGAHQARPCSAPQVERAVAGLLDFLQERVCYSPTCAPDLTAQLQPWPLRTQATTAVRDREQSTVAAASEAAEEAKAATELLSSCNHAQTPSAASSLGVDEIGDSCELVDHCRISSESPSPTCSDTSSSSSSSSQLQLLDQLPSSFLGLLSSSTLFLALGAAAAELLLF